MVATPTTIVDSYVKFLESIDLEPIALEPSMSATSRVFSVADPQHNEPTILIDFGAISIDLAVFDKTMIVNSTLAGGSELLTKLIADAMKVSTDEAFELKSKYGIGVSEKQQKITAAIQPVLDDLLKEVRRVLRYYTDRVGQSHRQIARIATSGGGAIMPGINQFLTRELNLPSKTLDPWSDLDFGHLKKPPELHQSAYITVAGEAILNPRGIYV
jgi:type IV pilus assembly protein PilM